MFGSHRRFPLFLNYFSYRHPKRAKVILCYGWQLRVALAGYYVVDLYVFVTPFVFIYIPYY